MTTLTQFRELGLKNTLALIGELTLERLQAAAHALLRHSYGGYLVALVCVFIPVMVLYRVHGCFSRMWEDLKDNSFSKAEWERAAANSARR